MASWVKSSQAYGTEWIISIERPQSALLSSLETENAHNYGFGNSLLFSSHIATNTPKTQKRYEMPPIPQHFRKGVQTLCFPWLVSCFVGWFWFTFYASSYPEYSGLQEVVEDCTNMMI